MYYDAFSRNVNEVIELATVLAKKTGCRYIGSEHILFGLINASDGRAGAILREAGVDNERYLYYFKKTIDKSVIIPGNMFTPRTKQAFERAVEISLKAHSGFVGTEHLLLSILLDETCQAVAILKIMRVDVDHIINELQDNFVVFQEEDFVDDSNQDSIFASSFKRQEDAFKQHLQIFVQSGIT